VEGTVTLRSAHGTLAGVLIKPSPGSEIVVEQPPGCPDACLMDLRLTGNGPGGDALTISSRPPPEASAKQMADTPFKSAVESAAAPKGAASSSSPATRKSLRRWFSLALIIMGIAVLLAAALFYRQEGRDSEEEGAEEGAAGGSSKSPLRLKAQLEALTKEKAQLQAALEEKTSRINQLLAEKTTLESDLERIRAKSQETGNYLHELEKKLQQAEQETAGVQQEYMALYARSQQEKAVFKRK